MTKKNKSDYINESNQIDVPKLVWDMNETLVEICTVQGNQTRLLEKHIDALDLGGRKIAKLESDMEQVKKVCPPMRGDASCITQTILRPSSNDESHSSTASWNALHKVSAIIGTIAGSFLIGIGYAVYQLVERLTK